MSGALGLENGVVRLVNVLRDLRGATLQGQRVVGVARLDAQLCQDPDAVGEFERLIQHVLALHVPLGDGVDVVVLELSGNRVCI